MANRSLRAQARNSLGEELTLHAQDTDAPVLPVAALEHLHDFRADLVDSATIGTLVVAFVTHNVLRKRQ